MTGNTFNLKENPHDWVGAEPTHLNTDLKNGFDQGWETLAAGEVPLVRAHLALSPENYVCPNVF